MFRRTNAMISDSTAVAEAAVLEASPPSHAATALEERQVAAPPIATDAPPAEARTTIGTFQAFSIRNFQLLWSGMMFTSIALWVQMTTIGWVAYDITGSGALLGSMNTMRLVPAIFVAPVAGVVADRIPRLTIVTSSQVVLLACTTVLGLILLSGSIHIWHLFAFTLVAGCAQTFNQPARQTLVFDVVPRHLAPNAIALSNMAMSFSRAFGPMVGGALIVWLGAANNFFMQSIVYVVVIAITLMITIPRKPKTETTRRTAIHKEMLEGYKFALGDRRVRVLLMMSVVAPLFLVPVFFGIMPIFAKQAFHTEASGLGILLAGVGVGGFFGGLLTASLSNIDRRGLMQIIALVVFSLALIGFSLVAGLFGSIVLALPFLFLAGAAESLYMTTNQTVIQLLAPDHMRGRLASVLQIGPLVWPIGSLCAGIASDHINIAIVGVVFSAAALAFAIGLVLLSPHVRQMRLSQLTPIEARA